MALILCEECGNQVSDSAKACLKCGFPVKKSVEMYKIENDAVHKELSKSVNAVSIHAESENLSEAEEETASLRMNAVASQLPNKKKIPAIPIILFVTVIICAVLTVIFKTKRDNYNNALRIFQREEYGQAEELFKKANGYSDANKYLQYCDAMLACNDGDYGTACDIFMSLDGFSDSQKALRQIYYETRLFEGLTDMRTQLKNADSTMVNDVKVYKSYGSEEAPIFIITISGLNGFGGYSDGYAAFQEDNGKYTSIGIVPSRVMNSYYTGTGGPNSLLDLDDYVGAAMIKLLIDDGDEIEDTVDKNRVTNIMKNKDYSNIKGLDELTFDYISGETY